MLRKQKLWFLALLFLGLVVNGCALQQPAKQVPVFQAQTIAKGRYQQKADNLVIILDSSSSMDESYNGVKKFLTARDIVTNFNQTMPDLNLQTEVRSFGHEPSVSYKSTIKTYGLAAYSRAGVAESLAKLKEPGGPSPLEKALSAAGEDLEDARGKTAIVLVSDGKDMGSAPLAAANALKAKYGDRLCIHTVLVGDDKAGRSLLEKIGGVTGCGSATKADALATGPQMADFVKSVLLTELADTDGDGVPDINDKCPNTPKGAAVDKDGCPLDSDRDGVPDYRDKCPGTPQGTSVDADGCPLPQPSRSAVVTPAKTWLYKDIKFEFDKATLRPASYPVLDEIVSALKAQPNLKIEVQGHTDSIGTQAYNMKLSERRAQTVADYLKGKGIESSRITAKGFGQDNPMDTNTTAAGQANNRRVELRPLP